MKNKNDHDESRKPPCSIEEMVEYIISNSPRYKNSERYNTDLGEDKDYYYNLGTVVGNSYGNYIADLMSLFVRRPTDVVDLVNMETNIRGDFEILEILCSSNNDDVLTAVATGIFEALADAESEAAVGAIVANLGPCSRDLWNDHIPGFTGRRFTANNEFKVMDWSDDRA